MKTLLFLFLLIFPKGGFKIGDLPITWGYLLLCLSALPFFFRRTHTILTSHFYVFLSLIPFQIVSLITFFLFGIASWAYTIAFLLHFFLFPILFFLVFSSTITSLHLPTLYNALRRGILFLALYGLFSFLFVHIFGFFFSIPLLTTNLGDLSLLEQIKCVSRDGLYKLTSTYNNGNLYGICLLMLLPLYLTLENTRWKRLTVLLSLLLTLSRTVWAGLFLTLLLRPTHPLKRASQVFSLIALIFLLTYIMGKDHTFLFDTTLGGRTEWIPSFNTFLSMAHPPFYALPEMTYWGIYNHFGLPGLLTFLIGITAPLWLSPSSNPLSLGLLIYLLISCSDGAILLIPVMPLYWFLSALLLGSIPKKICPLGLCQSPGVETIDKGVVLH